MVLLPWYLRWAQKSPQKNGPTAMSERYCDPHECPVWSWTHYRVGHVGGSWAQEVSCGNASQHTSKDQWNWLVFCFFMMLSMTFGHTTYKQNWRSNIWTKLSMCGSRAPSVGKKRSEKASTSKDQAFIQVPWIIMPGCGPVAHGKWIPFPLKQRALWLAYRFHSQITEVQFDNLA